ncbi:MAG TPA: class I SAM-dependent methyltransferase [Solirubrobacterales bacterium]|nr:class I SAM-dependent methyltransferase [Solirubrobacterales bacterium]
MSQELLERAATASWYHTLELAPGHVTEGIFDLRPVVDRYGLPERMDGMRALDVGTWDGFWAFEMERRGATVVALDLDDEADLDWPPRRRPEVFPETPRGTGFRLAKEIFGSEVERVNLSIYDATPEELGTFDLVFCGSVLIHLRDQFLALERIAGLSQGTFLSTEGYSRLLGVLPFPAARYYADREAAVVYWEPSARAWEQMIWSAGFDEVERLGTFSLKAREGWSVPHVTHRARKSAV